MVSTNITNDLCIRTEAMVSMEVVKSLEDRFLSEFHEVPILFLICNKGVVKHKVEFHM
jgi:hypothetical protein